MLQTKPRSWSRLTFASGLAGFCPVGRPLGSYPLGWFVGLLEKCPCWPWRLLTTALTTINLAERIPAATWAAAWGRPSACGGLSGRPDGPSITYGGFSTVRVRRGRSSPQQRCVPPRAAAILVRSGFVTRNPALSARPSSFRFARYTTKWITSGCAVTQALSRKTAMARSVA
jgi:hypothetical protein